MQQEIEQMIKILTVNKDLIKESKERRRWRSLEKSPKRRISKLPDKKRIMVL